MQVAVLNLGRRVVGCGGDMQITLGIGGGSIGIAGRPIRTTTSIPLIIRE
jgi:hypothetical protein